jgi:hypothetical protein
MYWAQGCGSSVTPGEGGSWISFSHTRASNPAGCIEFCKKSLMPFVDRIVGAHPPIDDDGNPINILSYCDGEQIMLSSVMKPEVIKLYNDRKMIAGKSSASISGRGQAQDVGPLHR